MDNRVGNSISEMTSGTKAVPVVSVTPAEFESWLEGQPEEIRNWTRSTDFKGEAGTISLVADGHGALSQVLFGIPEDPSLWDWACLPTKLPQGHYTLPEEITAEIANRAVLGWMLAVYSFDRYKSPKPDGPVLCCPGVCDVVDVRRQAEAICLARDLINTPANDMGPEELAEQARLLAEAHGASCRMIVGDKLVKQNYPAIYAVGMASPREPRLIDLRWGNASDPKITLVGKGVCFDTGGLDLKPSSGMLMMKKDMGGAAHALGAASMIMSAGLPVNLRVLIPAVENVVSGNAYKPMDVIQTRKGLSIEITNTDAEGRVILSDVLYEASGEKPDLIVDFATLTGAARIAMGTELPPFFCNNEDVAAELSAAAMRVADPLWRMPLWQGYKEALDSNIADMCNSPGESFGGAITAALFLERFVENDTPWVHFDVMAWNRKATPGHPIGGEASTIRAVYDLVKNRCA